MYVSRILVEGSNKELVRQLKELFNELGYFIVEKEPDVIISVGSIYRTLNKYYTKYKDIIIINVTEDGNNVIPISRELSGGSFIGGIVADSLGANLTLTSSTSIRGLYSIQEFSWLNGFNIIKKYNKLLNYINHKLIKNGVINIYSEISSLKYVLYDGYTAVKTKEEADVIISNNNLNDSQKLILKPFKIYVGIKYIPSIPFEVLVYSVKMTLKSLYLMSNRIDYI
ncbi:MULTISPECIES: cobalamin biosynthesis protein CbiG [Sulfolobaceae]|uniref:cobalamin biosynthesis protein CbiG n=1 Tax=Sulfolobaceae TaxID=118883 RepID=UPI001E49FF32|nr:MULTISPECIES: cobalamin biosynthesis protein CbiG [unclassified Sulfolobus]